MSDKYGEEIVEGPGEFVKGFRSSILSNQVGGHAANWFKAKQVGDAQAMANAEAEIERLRQQQTQYNPAISDVRQVRSLGDLAKWGAGTIGQSLASSGVPMLAGIAGGAIGSLAGPVGASAGAHLGASLGSYNMEANEAAATSFMDETVRNEAAPEEVIQTMRLKGAANAALEGLMSPTAVVGARVFGDTAKNAIRPGFVGGMKHAAKAGLASAVDEAATEMTQEEVGLYAQSHLNPNRDTSEDKWQRLNAAAQGFVGGGVLNVPGTVAELRRAQQPRDTDERAVLDGITPVPPPNMTDEQILAWDDKQKQDMHDAAYRLSGTIDTPEMQAASEAFQSTRDPVAFASALKQHVSQRDEGEDVATFTKFAKPTNLKKNETGPDEHDPEDVVAMNHLTQFFAPNSVLAKDKDRATEVYYALKDMLLNDPNADVPLERLAKSFGGEKFMLKALNTLRGDLVRMGDLEHDETASETMQGHIARRITGDKTAAQSVARYLKLEHGDISQREAGRLGVELRHRLTNYGQLSQRDRDEFEKATDSLFGSNKETALTEMGGRKHYKGKGKFDTGREATRMDNLAEDATAEFDEGDHESQSIFDRDGEKVKFVGNNDSEDQFFNTHYNNPTYRASARNALEKRAGAARAAGHDVEELTPAQYLRATSTDLDVTERSDRMRTIATQLGVPVEGRSNSKIMADLENHAARILKVTEGVLDEDSVKLSTEDILKLSAKEKDSQRRFGTKVVDEATAKAVGEALQASRQKGGFKDGLAKLTALGMPNAVEVVQARGKHTVKMNMSHGGEGRFTVQMNETAEDDMDMESATAIHNALKIKDPAEQFYVLSKLGRKNEKGRIVDVGKYSYAVSAKTNGKLGRIKYHLHHKLASQDLINDSYSRLGSEPKQKAQPSRVGMMGRQFAMSISSIMSNPDVKDVHVVDRFGHKHTPESVAKMVKKTVTDKEGNSRELTDEQHAAKVKAVRREYGRFSPFFKIGVKNHKPITLAQAARSLASKRGEEVSDNFSKMLEELGSTDETGRTEMINHLMNIVSNDAEAEALEQALTDEEATLTPADKKRLKELRYRNETRNKKKKLSDEELDELSDLEDTELLGEQSKLPAGEAAAISGEGRTPDTHMVEEGQQAETGVRKFNELTGDKVGSALKGSRKVEAAPADTLTLNLKNEVKHEDVPKVLNQLTKAVRDTAQILPKEMVQAMQDIYNLLGRAIDQKQTGAVAVQHSLRTNVKEQALDILRTELKFINNAIKTTDQPALRADGMRYRAAVITLAEKINKLIPVVEQTKNAEADVAMAVLREGEAATTYEQALDALNRLNKLITSNDGTAAQMKRLNAKQAELAAKVESLKPPKQADPVTQRMRDRLAALKEQFRMNEEGEQVIPPEAEQKAAEFDKKVDEAVAKADIKPTGSKEGPRKAKAYDPLFDAGNNYFEAIGHLKAMYRAVAQATHARHFDKALANTLVEELRAAYKNVSVILPSLGKYVQKMIAEYQAARKVGTPSALMTVFHKERTRIIKKLGLQPPDKLLSRAMRGYLKPFEGKFKTGYEVLPERMFAGYMAATILAKQEAEDGSTLYSLFVVPKTYYTRLKRAYLRENGLRMKDMTPRQLKLFDKAFRESLNENWEMVADLAMYRVTYDMSTQAVSTDGPSRDDGGSTAYNHLKAAGEVTDLDNPTITGHRYSKMTAATHDEHYTALGELAARMKAVTGQTEIVGKFWRDTGANVSNEEVTVVKLNEEGIGAKQDENISLEDMEAVKAYIKKTLGPKVMVAFEKALAGKNTMGTWQKTGAHTIISIALRAANPMSIARHEAMHEFFDRLSKEDPVMAAILAKAANSAPVKRQLEQIFNKFPAVIKAMENDEHERVAYMFEAWSAGILTVGPATETTFQRIVKMLKAVFGVLNEDAQAERIMEMFHEGQLSKPSKMAEVLANDPELQAAYGQRLLDAMSPIYNWAKYLLGTAHGQTAGSKNPHISWAGKEMYVGTGEKTNNLGFFGEKTQKTSQMQDEVNLIFKNLDDTDMKILIDGLQSRKFSSDPKILHAQRRVEKFLEKMFDYANREDPNYNWYGLGLKKSKDYFPRAWDSENIGNNRDQFVADLMKHHKDVLEKIADKGYDTWINGERKNVHTTAPEVAERIAEVLIHGRGATPNEENIWELGFAPFMAAKNRRSLDWLDQKHFSQYMQKDAVNILTTYVNQMVHTVEYSKRFGAEGHKLQKALNDAAYWELENNPDKKLAAAFKKARAELDATHKEEVEKAHAEWKANREAGYVGLGWYFREPAAPKLEDYIAAAEKITGGHGVAKLLNDKLGFARKQIMAMEGTLSFDISERMRKIQSNLIVYENLRMLWMSLFSNLVDPLGVMVHNGTIQDAFNTMKIGLEGVINGWRGKDSDNPAYALARAYGTIDASQMLNTMGQVYSSVWTDRTARRINDALFRANGVEGLSQGNRAGATVAAVNVITTNLTSKNLHDLRQMQELYGEEYDPKDVKLTPEGELDPADRRNQKAVFKLVDRMMMRPNAAMRPAWGSDPRFAIFFHMRQFTFAFQKVMLEHAYKEGKHGNYEPALVLAAGYVPMMIAADLLKDLAMYGGEPPWKKKWKAGDYIAHGVQRAGLLGVPQIALDVKQWGPAELAGPVVEQVTHAAKNYEKALKKDRHLDLVAAKTHKPKDLQKAEEYSGAAAATRKTLRDALPASQLFKRHLYDKYEPKVEKAVQDQLKQR